MADNWVRRLRRGKSLSAPRRRSFLGCRSWLPWLPFPVKSRSHPDSIHGDGYVYLPVRIQHVRGFVSPTGTRCWSLRIFGCPRHSLSSGKTFCSSPSGRRLVASTRPWSPPPVIADDRVAPSTHVCQPSRLVMQDRLPSRFRLVAARAGGSDEVCPRRK